MGFLDLFVIALMPVLKVLLVTAVGFLLATDRCNLLGPAAAKNSNNIIFHVFAPALVGSNLAETITFEDLVSLWFMPVNVLITFIIGSSLAWILIKITRTPPHLKGLVIGTCSAGNLGNLPMIIIPAICEESNSPFGDSSDCSTYGKAYASLSMVGAIYLWSYVYPVMWAYASNNTESERNDSTMSRKTMEQGSTSCKESLLPLAHPQANDYKIQLQQSTVEVSVFEKGASCIRKVAKKMNLKKIFAPSTIAAIAGFMIGTISPIRRLIIGDNAPLRVIDSAVYLLGEAAIPCTTLIVGANLLAGLKSSKVEVWVIIGVVALRSLVLPILGIGIVKAAKYFGIVGSDLLYQFVLLLQYAVPPVMNVGTITQLFEAGQAECSVILLWSHVVAAFSLTMWMWSTFYMWILT